MKTSLFAKWFMVLVLCVVLNGCGGGDQEDKTSPTLYFTAIPDQNTTELAQRFKPLADYLASELGVPVTYVPARDYQATVEMFRNQDVMLAWFGGLTGVQARVAVPGARAIAQGEVDPEYYSYFIAHEKTGLEKSDDFPQAISEHTFTFGSASSTSGRLMPDYFISESTGKKPADFFAHPVGFSGSHDKTCELVEAGQFACGVVNYKVYNNRVAAGKTDPEVCRIIWQTPRFADYNFTAHPKLNEVFGAGFVDKLQAALVGIKKAELLEALPRKNLISATNDDFKGIEKVARELGMVRG